MQIHANLKRAVFAPLAAARLPKSVAGVASFVASALFHEYQFVLTMPRYRLGGISLFFVAHAALCYAQTALARAGATPPSATPRALKVVSTVAVMAPFASLFTSIWHEHGMFDAIASATFTVKC